MQVQVNNPQPNQQHNNNSRKAILYFVFFILFLSFSTKVNNSNVKAYENVKNKIQNNQTIILQEILGLYIFGATYQGRWKIQQPGQSKYLKSIQGKYLINVNVQQNYQTMNFNLLIQLFDGYYIDKGVISFPLNLHKQMFAGYRDNNTLIYEYNQNTGLNTSYDRRQILILTQAGHLEIENITITFNYNNADFTNEIKLVIVDNQNVTSNVKLVQLGRQSTTLNLIIFSAVIMFVSVLPFAALMNIIKGIYELRDNPRGYSLLTIGFTCMWDGTLCFISFMYAFSDQQSLMLFIIQAFLLCLQFTNLQPRLMVFIFQHLYNNNNIRQIICKFNLFHYGTLLLTYPILLLSNINWILYIGLCCIIFPQISTNGVNGYRPDVTSSYYLKYILSRYLLIFYLKCYPYNVFYLEPDYTLTIICTLLISLQFFLLYVQKKFGAKKIIPSFLLEPVFNYKFEDQTNNEDPVPEASNQCAICLMQYSSVPPQNANQLQSQPKFKLMKTPCNHVYHSRCLMIWMKVKMQCPQCRQALPPFE